MVAYIVALTVITTIINTGHETSYMSQSHLVILGDFNLPKIEWVEMAGSTTGSVKEGSFEAELLIV